jgi:hypothetical protein
MDGLWTAGFTLLGVLVGGFFTFLGLKAQLKQQLKLDTQQWKRRVRSEPLLELRAKLSEIATTLHFLILADRNHADIATKKQKEGEIQSLLDDWRKYGTSKDYLQIFYFQYDTELLSLIEQIQGNFMFAYEYALDFNELKTEDKKIYREQFQKAKTNIAKAQELINKKLEEL